MAKGSRNIGDLLLTVIVGLLFVIIGIEGIGDFGGNILYREMDSDVLEIISGIILLAAGLLMIVPLFIRGIKSSFTKAASIVALVVWIIYILLADFVWGMDGNRGTEWFTWLEGLIYHLLILASIYKVASPAVKKLAK